MLDQCLTDGITPSFRLVLLCKRDNQPPYDLNRELVHAVGPAQYMTISSTGLLGRAGVGGRWQTNDIPTVTRPLAYPGYTGPTP